MMIGGDPESQRKLFEGGLGTFLHDYMKSIAAPLFWQTRVSGQWKVEAGGTCFFLLIGNEPIIVTAAHVYEEYCRRKVEIPHTNISICSEDINLEERLISTGNDYGVDIATFLSTKEEAQKIGKTVISGMKRSWPPERVKIGDRITFGGYPGIQRHENKDEIEFGLNTISCPVESVSDRGFSFQVPRDVEKLDVVGNGQQKYGASLGGISGSPVLLELESQLTGITMTSVGVVYSGSTQLGEIIQAMHIDLIDEDGKVRTSDW